MFDAGSWLLLAVLFLCCVVMASTATATDLILLHMWLCLRSIPLDSDVPLRLAGFDSVMCFRFFSPRVLF